MQTLEKNLQEAWDYIFQCLFNEKTNLIYDSRSTLEADGAFSHLPTIDEVKWQIPSPSSWNAGMENSGINGGVLLNTIVNRYLVTNDESLHFYAEKIIKGIVLLSTVSGVRGFLARSVHPDDLKSHFFESSRDQYTHVIFGISRYLDCALCTDEERETLTDLLISYAQYAEKCVVKENDYHLLRSDGGKTIFCKMIDCRPHEWTRLPMIYLAAWKHSKNEHWYEKYAQVREKAWKESYGVKEKYWSRPFGIAQMQESLRLLYDYEKDEEFKAHYLELMELVCTHVDDSPVKLAESAKAEKRAFDTLCPVWRKQPMRYLCAWGAPVDGYGYYMPDRTQAFERDLCDLHNISNHISIAELCPTRRASQENFHAFLQLFDLVDFKRHATEAPCLMLEAYWEYQAREKRN